MHHSSHDPLPSLLATFDVAGIIKSIFRYTHEMYIDNWSTANTTATQAKLHLPLGLQELHDSLRDGSYFQLNERDTLFLLHRAFGQEIEFLKSAYVPFSPAESPCTSPSPSNTLFEGEKYDEVDRTLTGALSLQWIYNRKYAKFVTHQNPAFRLTEGSFNTLYDFYSKSTGQFKDYETLFILIILQITNDLGKSRKLNDAVKERLDPASVSHNHDVVMSQILVDSSTRDLIPSFQCLRPDQQETVEKHIRLSAHFNPGQLGQAECPPAALDILTDPQFGEPELTLKFMEYFLDLAGALGHKNHEGAQTLTEPVFRGFWRACELTTRVAINHDQLSPKDAYNTVLTDRVQSLTNKGWITAQRFDIHRNESDYAKTRIFCMGRVNDAAAATKFNDIYDNLPKTVQTRLEIGLRIAGKSGNPGQLGKPAVLPTYMPQMLVNAQKLDKADEAVTALLTYLSRVLLLTESDRRRLQADTIIVERDVKDVLEEIMKSPEFKANPFSVLNDTTPLPETSVLQREGIYDC